MSRVKVIEGAISRYNQEHGVPGSESYALRLAEFIEDHLAPESPQTPEAYMALRMIRAQVDEVLKPRLVGGPGIPPEFRSRLP